MAKTPASTLSLKDRLIKNSTLEYTATLLDSKIYGKGDMITTQVPAINVALSGEMSGGFAPGILQVAAPSKHFKSGFALLMVASFLRKYPDGIILFYDSEFGTPKSYFKTFNIPPENIVHSPVTTVEELRHDFSVQFEGLHRDDKVMIIVDSIGNLASQKETQDAIEGNDKADMTRAKILKSFFRIVGPKLVIKDIPMVVINHTYKTLEMYAKTIVGGGTGSVYNSDNIWIVGRQQDKDGTDIAGYDFVITVEKSRYVKEKSKIPINISYETGINKWSGMLEWGVESGVIDKPKKGYYQFTNQKTGEVGPEYKEDDIINNDVFWRDVLSNSNLSTWVKEKFTLSSGDIISSEVVEEDDTEI
jgi:RecA/RadA recombinase